MEKTRKMGRDAFRRLVRSSVVTFRDDKVIGIGNFDADGVNIVACDLSKFRRIEKREQKRVERLVDVPS